MKVLLSWLNEFVRIDDISKEELASRLVSIGFEVEEVTDLTLRYENIVTGRIVKLSAHPNADKLKICQIETDSDELVTIVTGAPNVKENEIVPVALPGAVLAGGKRIEAADFRGVMSMGMLCSGKELGIDDNMISGAEIDGILLLPKSTPPGENIAQIIGMADTVFDISVTSNRPDCQSVFGLAREVSAMLSRKLKEPPTSYVVYNGSDQVSVPKVKIEDYTQCTRYYGNVICDVNIKNSPLWMRRRLVLSGMRPINNIVDITNYVLLEVGQPLHAFDIARVEGDINIRQAKSREKITVLGGDECILKENNLVIADDEKALAIAGVMGGEYSAITEQTSSVFLETARFNKSSIRTTSRQLGIRSDSSARFERGLDFDSVDLGRNRALNLFYNLKAGKILEKTESDEIRKPERKVIETDFAKINSVIGIDIPGREIVGILKALGFKIEKARENIRCTIPLFREDIDNFTDLSEEVIRFYGYDKLRSTMMEKSGHTHGRLPVRYKNVEAIKRILCGHGFYEAMNYSFIGTDEFDKLNIPDDNILRKAIRLVNPLSEESAVMRTEMTGSMIKTLKLNISHKNTELRLFEAAKVYMPEVLPLKHLPDEQEALCFGIFEKAADFYTVKNIVENIFRDLSVNIEISKGSCPYLHPGISADVFTGGRLIGSFGKLHPVVCRNYDIPENIYIAELRLESFIDEEKPVTKFKPLPKYPAADRDIAIILKEEYTAGEVMESMAQVLGEYLEDISLFDIYRGEQIEKGCKSLAFSLILRSASATMTESEINTLMSETIGMLKNRFDARLRD